MKIYKYILLASALSVSSVYAAGLAQLLDTAKDGFEVLSAQAALDSKQESLKSTKLGFLPKVEALGGYTKVSETSLIDAGKSSFATVKAGLTLFDGFRRESLIKERSLGVDAANSDAVYTLRTVRLQICELYFSLLTLQDEMQARQQKLSTLEKELARMSRFFDAGLSSKDRVEKLRAAFEQARYELESLHIAFRKNLYDLALKSNVSPESVELHPANVAPPQDLTQKIKEDIVSLLAQSQALKQKSIQAVSAYLPTVKLEDSYTKYRYWDADPAYASMRLQNQNKLTISASMTLFDFFSANKEREAVLYQKMSLDNKISLEKTRNDYARRVAQDELNSAKIKIESGEARAASAQATFELVEKKYQANLADDIAYLDALTGRFDAKKELSSAKNGFEAAKARYYFEYGYDIKDFLR